jgi:inorganic triphosphatase YgiF
MAQQGREIELKFHCAAEDLPAVLAAAPSGEDQAKELISVYFDTPDRALEKAGVSLRVRESGGRRVQTLKRGLGLSREEYEQPVEGFAPDPATEPLRSLLPAGGATSLSPAFYVGVYRQQRRVRWVAAEIEIALDQGEVRAGEAKSPISEVELELKAGSPEALFDLARSLMGAAPLYLSLDGKASVGQALLAGETPLARRRRPLTLDPQATAADAFQTVARDALAQIAANAQLLRQTPASEAVHQLRVAARRLRSALSTFAPLVKDARRNAVRADLRWLARTCDRARDLDVFAEAARTARKRLVPLPHGYPALLERLEAERRLAAEAVLKVVSSEQFRGLLLEVAAWVEVGPWATDPRRAVLRASPAVDFAARRLDRQLKRLDRSARGFAEADDEHRHRVRIQAKKLRYAAEAFASLFPEKPARKFVRRLKRLQDELGALNDAAVAAPLAETLGLDADAAVAAGELAGLRAGERGRHIKAARGALKELAMARPFWKVASEPGPSGI